MAPALIPFQTRWIAAGRERRVMADYHPKQWCIRPSDHWDALTHAIGDLDLLDAQDRGTTQWCQCW